MHISKDLVSYGKQVIRTPQQMKEFRKLYSEYRKLKSPFKKARNMENQICLWNQVSWQQTNRDAGFYCGYQTGLIGSRIKKLPVIKQLNAIGKFLAKISEKIELFRAQHNF